jgi:cell division protein FtsL
MTITHPKKQSPNTLFISLVCIALVAGAAGAIFEYNALVAARQEMGAVRTTLATIEATNADLKNERYQVANPSHLQNIATTEGLTLERAPMYLTVRSWQ